jgi:phage terminase large subunit GpA-like protein
MHLRYRDPVNFASEYQNEPETLEDEDESLPPPEVIAKQHHWCRRYVVPNRCDCLTAFVDVQQKVLFYAVVAWEKENFTGFIVDYGTWPDQKRSVFTKADAKITIGHKKRGAGWDACLRHALEQLIGQLNVGYKREDDVEMKIERGMIDANWAESTDVVYTFLKQFHLAPVWMPSHGVYLKAGSVGLNEKKRRSGEKRGQYWKFTRHEQYKLHRVIYDTNWWKSFHAARWRTTVGDPGSMYLYESKLHSLFAEHLVSEIGITVEAKGKRTTEWRLRSREDNDWLDCMVGNCVAASQLGARTRSIEPVIDAQRNEKQQPITMENVDQFYG